MYTVYIQHKKYFEKLKVWNFVKWNDFRSVVLCDGLQRGQDMSVR